MDEGLTRRGRKLDRTRDAGILDATLEVLAELGYHGMTIDLVAERAGAARATVYRRWATKADLTIAAVAHLGRTDAAPDTLPDTGTLRGDLLATIRPHGVEEQRLRIRVMAGLHAVAATDARLAALGAAEGAGAWIEVNRALVQRAVDRGEYPPPQDLDTLCRVIPTMCVHRVAVLQEPVTRAYAVSLIDGIVLPALRGGTPESESEIESESESEIESVQPTRSSA